MADIRNYLKEKEKREKGEVSYVEKIHKYRLSHLYRILLCVAVVCVIAIMIYIQYQNHVYETYEVLSSQTKETAAGITELRFGRSVLIYSKDGAYCVDSQGEAKWNQTYEMQSPMAAICGNVMAIADYNGRKIYIYDTDKKLGEIDTTMPIRSICVSSKGVVAAVLDDSGVTWIRLFDTEGTVLVGFKTSMKDFGYPFWVSLSPDSNLCAVSYIYEDVGEIKTSIGFYNFGEVGKNQPNNFVAGYDHAGSIVPYVQFMNNHTAFAVGDDRLVFYQGNQKPEHVATKLFSDELQGVYYSEKYVGLVFFSGAGSGKRLDIYDASGERVLSREFEMDHTDILFDNETFLIYNDTELYVGTIDGKEKYNGTFTEPIDLLVPTGTAYRYVAVTKDSIDVIRLR
ncbi:MAG: hypothetical protein HDR26_09210 [Lachnospiraceae bacterium]|nr:hypothetical protein [Lachnospiraceae bacterium]